MEFANCYEDIERAEAYATLEFARTYYLAYRDLPRIIRDHATGSATIDFGCGTGRSTRFLRDLGFNATGIDISEQTISKARQKDPHGLYRVTKKGDISQFRSGSYDLVLSAFTFDNIPMADKLPLFSGLGRLLKDTGYFVSVVSSPEIYFHEWASFSTKDFPENRAAKSGDVVRSLQPISQIAARSRTFSVPMNATGTSTPMPACTWSRCINRWRDPMSHLSG